MLASEASKRALCREYNIHWDTLQRILTYPEPPKYEQEKPRQKPKIGKFLPIIDEILENDQQVHRKQRHTAKRIFARLRDEHHYEGGYTGVKEAVRAWKAQHKEVFLPLTDLIPRKNWYEWKFRRAPPEFWDKPENRHRYLRWLGKRLGIRRKSDWYRLKRHDFQDNYGGTLLFYYGSHATLLRECMPEFDWDTNRPELYPRSPWRSSAR